jgi:hypothetical protein
LPHCIGNGFLFGSNSLISLVCAMGFEPMTWGMRVSPMATMAVVIRKAIGSARVARKATRTLAVAGREMTIWARIGRSSFGGSCEKSCDESRRSHRKQ